MVTGQYRSQLRMYQMQVAYSVTTSWCYFNRGQYIYRKTSYQICETRNIDIEVVDPSNGFAQITPTLQAASVGTEWTTFELEFTALANFSNAKIAVLLGNVDGLQVNNVTVTVDEFQIYEANQD